MIEEPKSNKNRNNAILVSIGIALVISGIVYSVANHDWYEGDVLPNINDFIGNDYKVGEYECDGWLFEGNRLVNKYHPEDDIEKWDQKDRDRYVQLENSVLEYCVEKINDVPTNYKFCKDTFQRINELLDKMVEREINSLSEEEQEEYHSLYQKWHGNGCERLKGEFTEMIDNQT